MINRIKSTLSHTLLNLPGWHTGRKIVVIESDDWGSIRMPSREVYDKCLKAGYPVDLNPYERYDSIASGYDLEMLFDLLCKYKDKNDSYPVITANCVVANPNFEKIEKSGFQEYHYELITETFKHYPEHHNNFDLWLQGKESKVFYPQFHAREHLNVSKFMKALQTNDSDAHFGFKNRMPGCIQKGKTNKGNYYVEATYFETEEDKKEKLAIYLEGLDIFKNLFGYHSLSVIPPNYTWSDDFNKTVAEKGVKYIQGNKKIREPVPGKKSKYTHRYLGMKNSNGQLALVRNVSFEPSLTTVNGIVDRVLSEIDIAFKMRKPAIISSHRINYVGYLDQKNREQTLHILNELLKKLLKKWPDVEFMSSDELGNYISEKK